MANKITQHEDRAKTGATRTENKHQK